MELGAMKVNFPFVGFKRFTVPITHFSHDTVTQINMLYSKSHHLVIEKLIVVSLPFLVFFSLFNKGFS